VGGKWRAKARPASLFVPCGAIAAGLFGLDAQGACKPGKKGEKMT
jgi:hypothetical protein